MRHLKNVVTFEFVANLVRAHNETKSVKTIYN